MIILRPRGLATSSFLGILIPRFFCYTRFMLELTKITLLLLLTISHSLPNNPFFILQPAPLQTSSSLRIVGADGRPNPVVNENNQLKLTVLDASARPVNDGLTFSSGSPEIASVDAQTGMVSGRSRGFATITVKRGNESVSSFVVVTRVEGGSGVRVPGSTERDMGGRIYIS